MLRLNIDLLPSVGSRRYYAPNDTESLRERRGYAHQLIAAKKYTAMADEKMVQNAVHPDENNQEAEENGVEMDCEADESNEGEFEALVTQLDQLNSALDFLESMADNVHAEVVELLKSNRETKEQFQESPKNESAEKSE